jgi:hypothetical protein
MPQWCLPSLERRLLSKRAGAAAVARLSQEVSPRFTVGLAKWLEAMRRGTRYGSRRGPPIALPPLLKRLGIVGLLIAPFAIGMAVDLPLCPSAALLGVPCPGCGLTRATLALLHGDLGTALRFHPLVPILAPVYVGLLGVIAAGYVRGTPALAAPGAGTGQGRGLLFTRAVTRLAWLLVILTFAVWILRFFGWFGGPVPVETYRFTR